MKKFAFAAVCTLAMVGFVLADEFGASITKVDGNKVTYFKVDKDTKKKADKDSTSEATKDAKVLKGAGGKKAGDPTPLEEGLKNALFTNIDAAAGVNATITTDDKGMITQIVTKGGGKGAAAGGKKGKKAALTNGDVD